VTLQAPVERTVMYRSEGESFALPLSLGLSNINGNLRIPSRLRFSPERPINVKITGIIKNVNASPGKPNIRRDITQRLLENF
jgi:hypothetical protein